MNFKNKIAGKKNFDKTSKKFVKVQVFTICLNDRSNHSHKKPKDSLEGSLERVLLAAEFEFPKIVVPRLPHHTSNVNIECAGTSEWSKQQYSLYVASPLEHWCILISLF